MRAARAAAKASLAGGLAASGATLAVLLAEQSLHPSTGPIDFSSPRFALAVAAIALAVGTVTAMLCLGLAVAAFGSGRLSGWRPLPAMAIGGGAGALVGWAILGLFGGAWAEPLFALLGALSGACTAFFWTRFARR